MGINRIIRTAAATVAISAAFGIAAGPASADTQRHRDPQGDVQPAPPIRGSEYGFLDVVRLRNTFEARTLTLSMTMVDLNEGGQGTSARWRIAAGGETYFLYFDYSRSSSPFIIFGTADDGTVMEMCARGTDVTVEDDTLTGTVPRRCLGDADRVRVAGGASARVAGDPGNIVVSDDSRRDGNDGRDFRYGPVLRRN